MLQKLKIKLVLINVISLTVVFFLAFLFIYFLLDTQLKSDERALLNKVALDEIIPAPEMPKFAAETEDFYDDENMKPPKQDRLNVYSTLSLFYVKKDLSGNIVDISPNIFERDDNYIIDYLVKKTDLLPKNEGETELGEVKLSFLIAQKPNGSIYVFIDRGNRVETMSFFIYFAAVSWAVSMLCVFVVSMFLASKAIAPVKESIEKQDKFVADASHELRTPISVIRTNVELVMDSPEETVGENMKWLRYIHSEAKRVAKMTEELLLLSRPNAKKETAKSKVNLSSIAESTFDSFRQLLKEHNLEYELDVIPDVFILADEDKIRQMLTILIDNAIKYTNEGSIKLRLEKDSQSIYIKVTDTGIGISKEDAEKIFERFFRADKSRTKNTGGAGLGLSIANIIAHEHSGKITVESEVGKGSEFCVTLPLAASGGKGNFL